MQKFKFFISSICLLAGLYFAFLGGLMFHANGLQAFRMMETYVLTLAIFGNFAVPFFYFYNKGYLIPVFVLVTALTYAGSQVHSQMHIDSIEIVCLVQVLILGVYFLTKRRPISKIFST